MLFLKGLGDNAFICFRLLVVHFFIIFYFQLRAVDLEQFNSDPHRNLLVSQNNEF